MANTIAGTVHRREYHVPNTQQITVSVMDSVRKWSPIG